MQFAAGARLGPYEILGPLGSGGMGDVYRARDPKLGREIAIKVLPQRLTDDPGRRARFEREARALAALNHPHIGAIYGFEEAPSTGAGQAATPALVLELVEGPTLAERLAAGPIPLGETLAIARQIAEALDAAHECGIVHRDLKPANVKITPKGIVKVLDFGLAKMASAEISDADLTAPPTVTSSGTREGLIVGTAAYMSPEQARGQTVDKRTDIWAFGCVLYEMLSGRRPFRGATITDTLAALLEREPDWSSLPVSTPPALRRLLRRCLEKDSRRRLHDIADARIELDDEVSGTNAAAAPPATPARANRLAWGLGAALLIALVATIGMGWIAIAQRATVAAGPRLSRPVRLTNTAAQEFGPAISPDGKWVAYYSNARGPTDIWIRFLDSGATLNLTASLNLDLPVRSGLGGLAISPDSTGIAFLVRQGPKVPSFDTWIMPAPVGGAPHKLLQVLQAVQWSPDGKRIVAVRPLSTGGDVLLVADADGANQREIVQSAAGRHVHWPAWSRDGRSVYFICTFDTWHTEPSEICRVPAEGGSVEVTVPTVRRAVYPIPLPDGGLMYSANPFSIDLGLWWRPAGGGDGRAVTTGFGEYAESRLSADGRRLVSTLIDLRQSLAAISLAGDRPELRTLTDGTMGDLDPSVDPKTDRMVFSSKRSGHRNLWMSTPDGSGATPLTADDTIDERPAFSPDGQQIAFVSDRGGRRGVWVIGAEGGAPKFLTAATVLDQLTWSRDGKRILFARPDNGQTRLAAISVADGSIEAVSTSGNAAAPAWSPSAEVIAYLEPTIIPPRGPSASPAARLWLRFVDSHGQRLHAELPDQSFTNGALAWAPDGNRLAGLENSANGGAVVWLIEPGAREPIRKLIDLPVTIRPRGITWSRDGSSVIIATQEPRSDIVMFDVEGPR